METHLPLAFSSLRMLLWWYKINYYKRPSHGKLKLANKCWQTQVGVGEQHKNSRQTRFYWTPTVCKRVCRLKAVYRVKVALHVRSLTHKLIHFCVVRVRVTGYRDMFFVIFHQKIQQKVIIQNKQGSHHLHFT